MDTPESEQTAPPLRGPDGRFVVGHGPTGGRPLGAVNKLALSLRQQILAGIGSIPEFVADLKEHQPVAVAGLLSRLLPSEPEPEGGAGGTVELHLHVIPPGRFLSTADLTDVHCHLLTDAEAQERWKLECPDPASAPCLDLAAEELAPEPELTPEQRAVVVEMVPSRRRKPTSLSN